MTIYRIFSDKQPDCMFASSLVNDVVVMANSEDEAKEIVKKRHGDNFVCDYEDVSIETICSNNESIIIKVGYFDDSRY